MKRILVKIMLNMCPLLLGAQQRIDLSGEWTVSLRGGATQSIRLPNTLDGAGIGEPNTLSPALSKPQLLRLTRKHSFIGQASYQREISVAEEMAGRPLELVLERVMWCSRLLIDGQDIGQMQESLVSPHVFRINGLAEGRHTLTLVIDNSKQHDISVDNLAHSYTNDTQIMWNGVLGRMELGVAPAISDVQVFPDIEQQQVSIKVHGSAADYGFALDGCSVTPAKVGSGEYVLPIRDMKLWNEFTPNLYQLTVMAGQQQRTVTFGMRSFTAEAGRLLVNGQPTFLRGTLECCIFPLTGTPPTDERGWTKVFATAREYGLNHLRFHSWCPPEAAFRVADKMGFYCQVELPHWSLTVNQDSATARFLYREADNILRCYGNHPSLCIVSCGNELQPDFEFLNRLTRHMKSQDPRHLYVTSTFTFEKGHGTKPEPEDDLFITQWTDNGWVRGQGVFDERMPDFSSDYREAARDITVPLISHEIGQYSVYPNIREIEKYTGVLEPLNFKAIRDDLQKKGLLQRADDYLKASGRLAVILYKEEIERALKTPRQSGFQLLDLHDFPGQGTALVGLLDAFWDSKGLVEPHRFREFCAPVVPLARFDKAVWKANETFTAQTDIANFSPETMDGTTIAWQLTDATGDVYAEGNGTTISISLNKVTEARRMELLVSISSAAGRLLGRNRWNIWVYPDVVMPQDKHILVTADVSEALRALRRGKKVLLSPPTESVRGLEGKFLPVFWSPVHFPKQAGTMGLLVDPHHPALAHFPTDMHSDWQWWNLVKRSRVMVMDDVNLLETFGTSDQGRANDNDNERSALPLLRATASLKNDNSAACMERGRPRPLRARRPRSINKELSTFRSALPLGSAKNFQLSARACSLDTSRTTAAGRDKSPFIVESVDNFTANRRLAQVFEARVGKGKLIFSSIDLLTDSQLPELRQMQYSLLRYMLTDDFQPSAAITEADLRSLLLESATEQKTAATSIYE